MVAVVAWATEYLVCPNFAVLFHFGVVSQIWWHRGMNYGPGAFSYPLFPS
jgi:hypothetical protein